MSGTGTSHGAAQQAAGAAVRAAERSEERLHALLRISTNGTILVPDACTGGADGACHSDGNQQRRRRMISPAEIEGAITAGELVED